MDYIRKKILTGLSGTDRDVVQNMTNSEFRNFITRLGLAILIPSTPLIAMTMAFIVFKNQFIGVIAGLFMMAFIFRGVRSMKRRIGIQMCSTNYSILNKISLDNLNTFK